MASAAFRSGLHICYTKSPHCRLCRFFCLAFFLFAERSSHQLNFNAFPFAQEVGLSANFVHSMADSDTVSKDEDSTAKEPTGQEVAPKKPTIMADVELLGAKFSKVMTSALTEDTLLANKRRHAVATTSLV